MTSDYWKKSADSFARFYKKSGISPASFVSSFLEKRTKLLQDLIKVSKKDSVLDMGCGSGVHMKFLAPQCQKIVGQDISPGMVNLAKRELSNLSQRNWKVVLGDAEKLPFKKNEFDIVIAMGLLDYVSSWEKVVKGVFRVLKKGGTFVCTIPKSPSLFSFLRTSWGNMLKKNLFSLPAVKNIVKQKDLEKVLIKSGFNIQKISSVWTTMWIVKAKKY